MHKHSLFLFLFVLPCFGMQESWNSDGSTEWAIAKSRGDKGKTQRKLLYRNLRHIQKCDNDTNDLDNDDNRLSSNPCNSDSDNDSDDFNLDDDLIEQLNDDNISETDDADEAFDFLERLVISQIARCLDIKARISSTYDPDTDYMKLAASETYEELRQQLLSQIIIPDDDSSDEDFPVDPKFFDE